MKKHVLFGFLVVLLNFGVVFAEETYLLSLKKGWNSVGLSLCGSYEAESLLEEINDQGGDCTKINRWLNSSWNEHILDSPSNNFDTELGQGYFIKCNQDSTWRVRGTEADSITMLLNPGWNYISIPFNSPFLTNEKVLQEINSQGGNCDEMDAWINEENEWQIHKLNSSYNISQIKHSEGYMVKCNKNSEFYLVVYSPEITCRDSDSGLDYYTEGSLTYTNNPFNILEEYDSCYDNFDLQERVCNDNAIYVKNSVRYSCPYGCSEGRCFYENEAPPSCKDSDKYWIDDEEDIYIPGNITYINNPYGITIEYDQCINKYELRESVCNSQIEPSENFVIYECPFGCENGVCNELDASELVSDVNYLSWYKMNSKYTPDYVYFGAYVIQPWDHKLYIGFGSARPAEYDGALLAKFEKNNIHAISNLTEQGVHDIDLSKSTLYIAGTDPCCSDGWDFGNVYTYIPSEGLIKHRNLPNVLHTWGLWSEGGDVYAAVSSHIGDYETWVGQVFKSTDKGESWERLSDLGDFRVYDIIGFNNKLYAIYNNIYAESLFLAVSTDGGINWSETVSGLNKARMIIFDNKLVILNYQRNKIITLDSNDQIEEHSLPFKAGASGGMLNPHYTDFNLFAADDNYLYIISEGGKIYRTSNLENWELVKRTGKELIAITYWPSEKALVYSSRGRDANIWKIELINKNEHLNKESDILRMFTNVLNKIVEVLREINSFSQ
ncbi:MAG: exo-alpha-sialidase [Candidatus Aenigmarchaeota archaeon]|nr:exo-alpha-sialidase [Candidatus Aenigmarchaeota archaeon]